MSSAADSGFDFSKSKAVATSAWSRLPKAEEAVAKPIVSDLDSEKMQYLHRMLLGFYKRELSRQEANRYEMAMDEDFYDNIQWDPKDVEILNERGQQAICYNVISSTIDWILGTEKRSRTDYRILPRRKESAKAAERKTQLMKYLSDVNRFSFERSRAFEDAVKVGVGWLESSAQDDDEGELVYGGAESWRNILWDSSSKKPDTSDGRYQIRVKWADEDVVMAMFPKRKEIIRLSAVEADSYVEDTFGDDAMDSQEERLGDAIGRSPASDLVYSRRRVRLIEVWYRAPVEVDLLNGGDFSGQAYDDSAVHREEVDSGRANLTRKVKMRMHVCIMTPKGMLFASQSPYRHNGFPFTPIWAKRSGRNNLPYGVIRGLRDIQQDINKRASKALAILSSNKAIIEEGAVDDIDAFEEEKARPDGTMVVKKNARVELNVDRELAPAHLELMSRSIMLIQSVSGVTDENMGRSTNAHSGIAIQSRQNQGALATAGLFDNLRMATQIHGEKELSLIEQFFTEQKSFRITDMRGKPEYIVVNDLPENDITKTKADFIITDDEWRATVRQAQMAELLDLLSKLAPVAPQIVLVMIDLVVEKMDIPNREEIVRRIRQATGARDPDAEEPTPEEIAAAQEKAKQAAMQEAMVAAEIAGKQADAKAKEAQAAKTMIDVEKVASSIAAENAGTQKVALETALAMISAPAAVPVADGVLHEAGFKSRTEHEDDALLEDAVAQQAMQQQAEAEQQAAMEQQAAQEQQQQPMEPMQ